ncbi:MAG: ATPase, T2SS/T4P/T4SS family [Elusimicrobia bacterium]|nr:ATPase, T2SS/T4P/T4SS family [Elusimicrobiota bacterium]
MSKILCVDDDEDIQKLLNTVLSRAGFQVTSLTNPKEAVSSADNLKPDLILLDVMMPELSGYDVCALLRKNPGTVDVPVIFLTALNQPSDKMKALSLGAVDFISKPFDKSKLISSINQHLAKEVKWAAPQEEKPHFENKASIAAFKKELLSPGGSGSLNPDAVNKMTSTDVYKVLGQLDLSRSVAAKTIAAFLKLPFIAIINPDNIKLDVFPARFARANSLVAILDEDKGLVVVMPNPFDFELLESIRQLIQEPYSLAVSDPDSIANLYSFGQDSGMEPDAKAEALSMKAEEVGDTPAKRVALTQAEESSVKYITAKLIESAIHGRASDVHIEPKELFTAIRFRVDGDLREFTKLKKDSAIKVLTRLKVLGGLDIAERRRPQDGAFVAGLGERKFTLRLATTATNYGESMVIRFIEPYAKPKTLTELGMDKVQVATMAMLAGKNQSMIILAGPTGSGKTTTVYSFLSGMDTQRRSLISVEDPIEFRIPNANQQQVNEKAGATFEALLKSSVRQDPDILFMGEIRDKTSAQTALDFASTGHLTISTIHTSNATTAVFRLERLGVTRAQIAYTMLAIVSQRLIKRLCVKCREMRPSSAEIVNVFSRLHCPAPRQTAHPVGCVDCNNTGYNGREAVYEILIMTPEVSEMIRLGDSIVNIRETLRRGNVTLITDAALTKITEGITSFNDAYEKVLAEDLGDEISPVADDANLFLPPPESVRPAPGAIAPYIASADPAGHVAPAAHTAPAARPAPAAHPAPVTPPAPAALPGPFEEPSEEDEDEYIGVKKPAAPEPPAPLPVEKPKKILVVDDDPDILLLAQKVISGAGYDVTAVKDGIEAIM